MIWSNARVWAVHMFTALGVVFGMLALIAASRDQWAEMFVWLGCALLVDGIDGHMARSVRAAQLLPRFKGEVLDLVIDYLTYVVIPAFFIYKAWLVPWGLGLFAACLVCFISLYNFADSENKSGDYYFVGFPALWNVAVFYMVVLDTPLAVNAALIAVLGALTFVPFKVTHPMRVRRWRWATLPVTGAWGVFALLSVYQDLRPDPWIIWGLCGTGAFIAGVGLLRTAGEHAAARARGGSAPSE